MLNSRGPATLCCVTEFSLHISSRSGRSSCSEVVFDLLVKIFKKNVSEWCQVLTTCILPNDGKTKVNTCRPTVQTEVGRALLAAVTPSLDAETKTRYAMNCFLYG